MAWELKNVTVGNDPKDSTRAFFTIGGVEGFSIDKDELKDIAAGRQKSFAALVTYIAITAAMSGADLSTQAKAKQYIESRQWPW